MNVRGTLSLYRLAGKESYLNDELVAYLVSRNHRMIRARSGVLLVFYYCQGIQLDLI